MIYLDILFADFVKLVAFLIEKSILKSFFVFLVFCMYFAFEYHVKGQFLQKRQLTKFFLLKKVAVFSLFDFIWWFSNCPMFWWCFYILLFLSLFFFLFTLYPPVHPKNIKNSLHFSGIIFSTSFLSIKEGSFPCMLYNLPLSKMILYLQILKYVNVAILNFVLSNHDLMVGK